MNECEDAEAQVKCFDRQLTGLGLGAGSASRPPIYFTDAEAGLGLQAVSFYRWHTKLKEQWLPHSFGIHCKPHMFLCLRYKAGLVNTPNAGCIVHW